MGEPRLIAALADIERHVAQLDWDQPARLFALVSTAQLLKLEPQLRGRITENSDDALTAIEQDDFVVGDDLFGRLQHLTWPDSVEGCALAMERTLLPSEFEDQVPADEAAAVDFVNSHHARIDVRFVVGTLRDGSKYGLGRLRSNPDDLLGAEELVPGLADALADTFRREIP